MRAVLALGLLFGLGWFNLFLARTLPLDTDFLVNWAAVRAFATESVNPYSAEVSARIETMAYGRPALSGEPRLIFHLPLYGGLLYLPFALLEDYVVAKALWLLLLELALLLLAWVSVRLCDWQPRPLSRSLLWLYALLGLHSVQALLSGSGLILIALLFILALWALQAERDDVVGMLLALATFQPETTFLGTLLILLWAGSQRRWAATVWFFASIVILSIIAFFFMSDWWWEYLRIIWNQRQLLPELSPVRVFSEWWPGVGRQLGWGMSLSVLALLLREWFFTRQRDFRWFLWMLALALTLSPWSAIPTDTRGFVLLLFPLALTLSTLEQRAERGGVILVSGSLLLLSVGLWALYLTGGPDAMLRMLFPLPAFLLLLLYWVRWWFLRPPRLYVEELRASEALR